MKAENLISGIERFFYDIVGSLIPGSFLLGGLWVLGVPSLVEAEGAHLPEGTLAWGIAVALAYVSGSLLVTLGSGTLAPIASCAARIWNSLWAVTWRGLYHTRRRWLSDLDAWIESVSGLRISGLFHIRRYPFKSELDRDILGRESVKRLAATTMPRLELEVKHLHELRNMAMTLISVEDRATVKRFMFLSMMSMGTATALPIILASAYAINPQPLSGHWQAVTVLSTITILGLLIHRFEFFRRALTVAYDMALAEIWFQRTTRPGGLPLSTDGPSGLRTVYLAGGFREPWQETVKASGGPFSYRDPSEHGIRDAAAYTAWDLEAVRRSDILFAYLQASNPSGFGLVLEVGYAAALGKHVIFVDERSPSDEETGRYLDIVRETADVHFDNLGDGLEYLRNLSRISP